MKTVNTEKLLDKVRAYDEERAILMAQAERRVDPLVTAELERITPQIRASILNNISIEIDRELLSKKAAIIDECIIDVEETEAEAIEAVTDNEIAVNCIEEEVQE